MLASLKNSILKTYEKKVEAFASICESEIEKIFLLRFIDYWVSKFGFLGDGLVFTFDAPYEEGEYRKTISNGDNISVVPYSIKILDDAGNLELIPQFRTRIDEKSYRLDFLLIIENTGKPTARICIECGYEYHHKDVQKVSNDFERNIDLMKFGYYVAQYTGSQINRLKTREDFEKIMNDLLLLGIEPHLREEYIERDKNRFIH